MGRVDRAGVQPRDDEPGDVRDVREQPGPDLIGDRAERGEVDGPRVAARTRDDQPRPVPSRERKHLVVVDPPVARQPVVVHREVPPRDGWSGPVRQVSAVVEREAQHDVPGVAEAEHHEVVRGRAGVRLDQSGTRAERVACPCGGEPFDGVGDAGAGVEAGAGHPLCREVVDVETLGGVDRRVRQAR